MLVSAGQLDVNLYLFDVHYDKLVMCVLRKSISR